MPRRKQGFARRGRLSAVWHILFFVVALTFWYALAFEKANMPEQQSTEGTPLATQVDQLGSVLFRIGRSASDGARVITPHRIQW